MKLATNEKGAEEAAGVVMLGMPLSQMGPFRRYVEKLLVRPTWRKRGIARRLMERLEVVGKERGGLCW